MKKSEILISKSDMTFDLHSNIWALDRNFNISWLDEITPIIAHITRNHLADMAIQYSFNTLSREGHLLKKFLLEKPNDNFCANRAISFIISRPPSEIVPSKRTLKRFYRKLYEHNISNINENEIEKLDQFNPRVESNGTNHDDSPFTDTELSSILISANHALTNQEITIQKYVYIYLVAITGRRSKQISYLKFKDFYTDNDGSYWVNIPRVKAGRRIRENFNSFRLSEPFFINLLKALHENVIKNIEMNLKKTLNKKLHPELPLFPNSKWPEPKTNVTVLKSELSKIHISHEASGNLGSMLTRTIEKFNISTTEHGKNLHANTQKFRYSLLSRLLRKNIDFSVAAELMDHNNARTLRRYFKNSADLHGVIELLLNEKLAPIAEAFTKPPITSESDADFSENPLSRTHSNSGQAIGSCSSNDLGQGCRPLQCYTCNSFQPWLHADHNKVLKEILEEVQQHIDDGQSDEFINSYILLILGVKSVIDSCTQRIKEVSINEK